MPQKIKPEKALMLIHKIGLSRGEYDYLNEFLGDHFGKKPLPDYKTLSAVKKDCYPTNITVCETEYRADPIELCRHSVKKVLQIASKERTFENIQEDIDFEFKYGNRLIFNLY